MTEDNTLECAICGKLLVGDEPRIVIECDECRNKIIHSYEAIDMHMKLTEVDGYLILKDKGGK